MHKDKNHITNSEKITKTVFECATDLTLSNLSSKANFIIILNKYTQNDIRNVKECKLTYWVMAADTQKDP